MSKYIRPTIASVCLIIVGIMKSFDIQRYFSYILDGKTSYTSSLIIQILLVISLILTTFFVYLEKKGLSAITLSVSAAVSLYQTFSYLLSIAGNAMNFGIVFGNVMSLLEIALFVVPLMTVLLPAKANAKKVKRFALISEAVIFIVSFGARIAEFSAWGKNFFTYFTLFFQVYAPEIIVTLLLILAFSLLILISAGNEKNAKNRK